MINHSKQFPIGRQQSPLQGVRGFLFLSIFLLFSCNQKSVGEALTTNVQSVVIEDSTQRISPKTPTEQKLEKLLLVDIQSLDSTLLVELKYATTDNFTKKILYKDLNRAYLQPDAAAKLVMAHQYLKEKHPDMRLLVYDAVRPLSVQKIMYESVKNTPLHMYVAEPGRTGLHNYAAAVDLTIVDANGKPLDMGTAFDYFGKAAGINNEEGLIKQGVLTRQQVENRKILRSVMLKAGFLSIRGEWWHFNTCSLTQAKSKYKLIETF